jgi:hypothetical protein
MSVDADGVWTDDDNQMLSGVPEPSDLEERAGIDSLEELQNRRRLLIERNTKLFALHGSFGHYDDHRKRMVEALKVKARMELSAGREKKPTEAEIDAAAYGSEDYQRFIDQALSEKIDYLKIATEIDEIQEAIRSRELELTAYSRELTLR